MKETSRKIYIKLKCSGRIASIQRKICAAIRDYGGGANSPGLTARLASLATGVDLQSVTQRFVELRRMGLIEPAYFSPGKTALGKTSNECSWYRLSKNPPPKHAISEAEFLELSEMNNEERQQAAVRAGEVVLAAAPDWEPRL
jgi:hypothetical protein